VFVGIHFTVLGLGIQSGEAPSLHPSPEVKTAALAQDPFAGHPLTRGVCAGFAPAPNPATDAAPPLHLHPATDNNWASGFGRLGAASAATGLIAKGVCERIGYQGADVAWSRFGLGRFGGP